MIGKKKEENYDKENNFLLQNKSISSYYEVIIPFII